MPAVNASYVAYRSNNNQLRALFCIDGGFHANQPMELKLEPGVYGLNLVVYTTADSEQDDFHLNLHIPVNEVLEVLQHIKDFPEGTTKVDPNTLFNQLM